MLALRHVCLGLRYLLLTDWLHIYLLTCCRRVLLKHVEKVWRKNHCFVSSGRYYMPVVSTTSKSCTVPTLKRHTMFWRGLCCYVQKTSTWLTWKAPKNPNHLEGQTKSLIPPRCWMVSTRCSLQESYLSDVSQCHNFWATHTMFSNHINSYKQENIILRLVNTNSAAQTRWMPFPPFPQSQCAHPSTDNMSIDLDCKVI